MTDLWGRDPDGTLYAEITKDELDKTVERMAKMARRIEQLEKVMRGILAVDPDFGHGSAIVRNIQKMVRAALPEDRE